MADITYTVNQDSPENIEGFEKYSEKDLGLVDSFQINNIFDPTKHFSEVHILSLADELIESIYDFAGYKLLSNAQSAGKEGASVLTLDPVQDVKDLGYENGEVKLLYHFLNDVYSDSKIPTQFYIEDISADRTELRLNTLGLTSEQIIAFTGALKAKIAGQSYFAGFRLNFENNDLLIAVNVDTLQDGLEQPVVVKLYEPLPTQYEIKDTLRIVEEVSDSVTFTVDYNISIAQETAPTLRAANFNIEVQDEAVVPTGYYNYNELFSFPITNANSQIFSTVSEKSINISVDYSDYTNFVHFSSAQERLLNFKYKLDLINHYRTRIASTSSATTGLTGVAGSTTYYENLIQGILNNFDHYERYLYFEAGDSCWPKYNTVKPYDNMPSNDPIAVSWYTLQLQVAAAYDDSNFNALTNTIPTYLRDDSSNQNYLTFIYMIGQHFDNLWLYSKAVTDKYDADNRLDRGISKDLVAEALRNFGVKLYTSNKSTEELFSMFVGQAYQSGNEDINNHVTATIAGTIDPIEHSSFDNYQKEIQKRMYHNLPFLLKSKGTERGLRALINCFGISSDILTINIFGGRNTEKLPFYGDYQSTSTSLDKVRLDYTGSIIPGDTLSTDVSIIKRDKKYTDDLHQIEVGFSPTTNVDNHIIAQLGAKFNIDDYLGNPSNLYADNYAGLGKLLSDIAVQLDKYNLQDYVRLIKFFDNVIFKTVKDFIPARVNADTGIIIKPNVLTRNKAKGVEVEGTRPEYSGSIDTAFITGSHGGSFRNGSEEYSTNWAYIDYSETIPSAITSEKVQTPFGIGARDSHQHEETKYNGEFSGSLVVVSNGEWNRDNTFKVQTASTKVRRMVLLTELLTGLCTLEDITSYYNITSHDPRNLKPDFPSIVIDSTIFTSASVDITAGVASFDFPDINYVTHSVTASLPELEGCEGRAEYHIQFCDLVTLQGTTTTVAKDTSVAISDWFTRGTNTDTSYTASWGSTVIGVTSPYTFTQAADTVVRITLKDNIIGSCSTYKDITITEAALPENTFSDGLYVSTGLYPGGPSSSTNYNPSDYQQYPGVITVNTTSMTLNISVTGTSTVNGQGRLYIRDINDELIHTLTANVGQVSAPVTLSGPGTYYYYIQASATSGYGNVTTTIQEIIS